jgi:hypothetical protein
MEGAKLFLMIFGALLALIGIALFVMFIWFKKNVRGRNTIKLFKFEVSLSQPALVVFVIGCMLMVIPFFPKGEESTPPPELPGNTVITELDAGTTLLNELDLTWTSRFFMLGYDYWDVFDNAFCIEEYGYSLEAEYDTSVHRLIQSADIVYIKIDVPDKVLWTTYDDLQNYFLDLDRELQAKLEVEDTLSLYPYYYGKWTRQVLSSVFQSYGEKKENVQKWLGDTIDNFDNNVRDFLYFNISNTIIQEYDYLYLDLQSLKRVGEVSENDYYGIVDRIQRIISLIQEEAGI